MAILRSKRLTRAILNFPGYKIFGDFIVLPICFLCGAALEFTMINWHVGEINFYKTFKRRQATERAEAIVNEYLEEKKLELEK